MRFQGNALYAMVGITAGTVLNIGLAPLLIFVFNMGIAGAAWATLCGQVCSFFILLYMDSRGENIRVSACVTLLLALLISVKLFMVGALHFAAKD